MQYFTINELISSETARRKGISEQFSPPATVVENLTRLINNALDPIRKAYGKPITVNCGYRCPRLNSEVGGKPTSYHLWGHAADIDQASNAMNKELWRVIVGMVEAKELVLCELIWEKGDEGGPAWIHVAWNGSAGKIKRCIIVDGKEDYPVLTLAQAKRLGE